MSVRYSIPTHACLSVGLVVMEQTLEYLVCTLDDHNPGTRRVKPGQKPWRVRVFDLNRLVYRSAEVPEQTLTEGFHRFSVARVCFGCVHTGLVRLNTLT